MEQVNPEEFQPSNLPPEEVLEACFRHDGYFILITSLDIPHEETLTIRLLDDAGKTLEEVEVGANYTPGIFKMESVDSTHLDFTFWPGELLRLAFNKTPKFVLQAEHGVKYRNRLSRHHLIIKSANNRN